VFDEICVDELRVEQDLFAMLIIDQHAVAADDAEAAGIFWPEPGGVQGGFDVVGEVEVEVNVVCDGGLESGVSVAGDAVWMGADEMEKDGDIVDAEGPEGVLC